jgi:hypothetical protein
MGLHSLEQGYLYLYLPTCFRQTVKLNWVINEHFYFLQFCLPVECPSELSQTVAPVTYIGALPGSDLG